MDGTAIFQRRELYSKIFLTTVSIVGWLLTILMMFDLQKPQDLVVLFLLIAFLSVSEYYPMPVWRGQTAISFPLVYVLYILYGMPLTILVYSIVVLVVNWLYHRPLRIVLFNPAQLVISFFLAVQLQSLVGSLFSAPSGSLLFQGILNYFILLGSYYLFNNIIVDLVLLIRPQRYPFSQWKQKTLTELSNIVISLVYGSLLHLFGNQNRGEIDVFSYFFFFSPLVGIALLSSTIARLKREKNRLKALFSLTKELNSRLPTKEWVQALKHNFHDFISVEAMALWVKEESGWTLLFKDGSVDEKCSLPKDLYVQFEETKNPYIKVIEKNEQSSLECFSPHLKSYIFSPLVIEEEPLGMLVIARSRIKSFEEEDLRSIATLSNQIAVVLKTKMLFAEKEKRMLLEERNRIAREIHDGVAQTLAGAIMKLETAEKKHHKNPVETIKLVKDSAEKLRISLKEVRESIYALRPYPTDKIGLAAAISSKIEEARKEFQLNVHFEIRGNETELSSMVEKVLFDIFKESLQNAIKHANASEIDILLSYQTENILLRIKDNGRGFSLFQAMLRAQNQPHFGILQMNDAAEKISASLQIDSKEGNGTEISLTVPRMGFEGGEVHDQTIASG